MSFSRSLVPQMLRPTSDWWDLWDFPPRIFDQHFGLGLNEEDLLPLASSPFYPRSSLLRRQLSSSSNATTAATSTTTTGTTSGTTSSTGGIIPRGISEVSNVSNQFAVSLDVSQFAPNEITVKAIDNNCVVIEGKHEERPDEHGYISRHFQRRYMLPKGIEADKIVSSLSPEGILTVSVPKLVPIEEGKPKEKVIPINFGSSPIIIDPGQVPPSTCQLISSSQSTNNNEPTTNPTTTSAGSSSSTTTSTSNQKEQIHQIQVESSVQQESNIVQQPIQQTEPAKPATETSAAVNPVPPAEPQQPVPASGPQAN